MYREDGTVCHLLRTDSVPGVLDMKWQGHDLAVALSDGTVQIRSLSVEGEDSVSFDLKTESTTSEAGVLALALSWSPQESGENRIAVSSSKGDAIILHLCENDLEEESRYHCHDYEAWCIAWDVGQPHVFYTGGDDCALKVWDSRCSGASRTVRKHSMGVTAIQPHPCSPHLLASGSYDESVLFWDARAMRSALADAAVGGGVWRLKWNPSCAQLLAVAAMHGGACVLRHTPQSVTSVGKFTEHESMVYGIDWGDRGAEKRDDAHVLASCSFYDRSLHLWQFEAL